MACQTDTAWRVLDLAFRRRAAPANNHEAEALSAAVTGLRLSLRDAMTVRAAWDDALAAHERGDDPEIGEARIRVLGDLVALADHD